MTKNLVYILILLCLFGAEACTEELNTSYDGKNGIYLRIDGDPVISETDEKVLKAWVEITKSCDRDIELGIELLDDQESVLSLSQKNIKIIAGTIGASFDISSNNKDILIEDTYISIGVTNLPSGDFELKDVLRVRVKPNPKITPLTEEQRALIEGYKQKYGFDLSDWLGIIPCKVNVKSPAGGSPQIFENAFEKNLEGKTIITLSEKSTSDQPILKMTDNPLGLTEYMYWVLRQETIENKEYWNHPESKNTLRLMEMINWNEKSAESFNMSLDALKLIDIKSKSAMIDFLREKINIYDEIIKAVGFDYSFSAWNRQKKILDNGNSEMKELYTTGISANPEFYLFMNQIDKDAWGDSKNYIAPTATIDFEKGEMNFLFVFDHRDANGYSKITVNYYKNK